MIVQAPTISRSTMTDDSGSFRIAVPPGTYQLRAHLPGFQVKSQVVTAGIAQSATVDVIFETPGVKETVTVAASEAAPAGPWWNTWVTRRGASESITHPTLRPDAEYTFYLELSAQRRARAGGIRSAVVDRAFLDRLRKMATTEEEGAGGPVVNDAQLEPALTFRFLVIGRAARLLESRNNVAAWQDGRWQPLMESNSATTTVQLAALFQGHEGQRQAASVAAARAGAVRFGIKTGQQPGCAAVAVSVWDETGRMPMDSIVYYLEVGGAGTCDRASAMKQASIGVLKAPEDRNIEADAALHTVEFMLNGVTNAASFMVLRKPLADCAFYSWSSAATVSGLVLENRGFKALLQEARRTDGHYASVAAELQSAVFPPSKERCGSNAAWAALLQIVRAGDTRLFARFTDRNGQLQAVPLGLLAMMEKGGAPLFPHQLTVIEPLPRESLEETSCVSAWTFVLPSKLHGLLGEVSIPPWAADDSRVLRSRSDFETRFLKVPDSADPLGLLLLAHHEQGVLTFSDAGDRVPFPHFTRRFGDGSIAVLSACETSDLDDNARLIATLNDNGVDAIVTSPFVVDPTFGATFAAHFATVVHELEQETSVEELFRRALSRTAAHLEEGRSRLRARGMTLELVLAGNPRLRVCPRRAPAGGQ